MLALYHPSSSSDDENAILIVIVLEFCQGREVALLGDFNLPSLQWSAGGDMFATAS